MGHWATTAMDKLTEVMGENGGGIAGKEERGWNSTLGRGGVSGVEFGGACEPDDGWYERKRGTSSLKPKFSPATVKVFPIGSLSIDHFNQITNPILPILHENSYSLRICRFIVVVLLSYTLGYFLYGISVRVQPGETNFGCRFNCLL